MDFDITTLSATLFVLFNENLCGKSILVENFITFIEDGVKVMKCAVNESLILKTEMEVEVRIEFPVLDTSGFSLINPHNLQLLV